MQALSINEIKYVKSLSQKKFREETGLFVVEGEKMVKEAVDSSFEIERIYREREIGPSMMSRISQLNSAPPVLALVRIPASKDIPDLSSFAMPGKGLFLVLDGIHDPGNLGTIIRLADWFGIDGIFASEDTVELFNPKVVQSTMGAIFRMKFHYCKVTELCHLAKNSGANVYGTFLEGEDIYSCDLKTGLDSPSFIVIGSESFGISKEVAKNVTDRLFIPSYPPQTRGSESLNAAIAAAVTVAEFRRRV